MGYSLRFGHEDIGDNFANCLTDGDEKWCVIKLTTDWGKGDTKPLTCYELDKSAFHEVMHLRLGALRWLAKARFTSVEEIERADEETVVALENFHRNHT